MGERESARGKPLKKGRVCVAVSRLTDGGVCVCVWCVEDLPTGRKDALLPLSLSFVPASRLQESDRDKMDRNKISE